MAILFNKGFYYRITFYTVQGVKDLSSTSNLIEHGLIIVQEITKKNLKKFIQAVVLENEYAESTSYIDFIRNQKGYESIDLSGWVEVNLDSVD